MPQSDRLLSVPPNLPRTPPNRFIRWAARQLMRAGGWRMVGAFPDLPKAVLIGAPHSSNWDGIWGLAAKIAIGLDVRIVGKHQLFWWPLGPILRRIGVIEVNREAAQGLVGQLSQRFADEERFWLGLAPEGTRKRVERWKPGFWKIAKAAGVPVVPAYFHYPDKVIGIGEPFVLTDDMDADIARIRAWFAPWQGKNRGV
ncbi:MAG: lysophospholipid acyltransferase family protein [Lysobacteraceae bacterium]